MMGSELEKRFISCLQENKNLIVSRSYAHQGAGWIINTRSEPMMSWHLKAQVDLGAKEAVGILVARITCYIRLCSLMPLNR